MRSTSLTLLAISYTLPIVGSGLRSFALSFAVSEIGGHAEEVGIVLAAQAAPSIILLLVAGVVADRLPRRRVMISADIARAATEALVAYLLLSGHASITALVLLSGALGVGNAFVLPTYSGFLPQIVTVDRLMAANSVLAICASIGGVLGSALGGLLVAKAGPGWAIAIDAASFVVSALCLLAIRIDDSAPRSEGVSVLRQFVDGWSEFRKRRWLWILVSLAALWNVLFLGPIFALGFARSTGRVYAWGGLLAIKGAGEVFGNLTMIRIAPRYPLRFALMVLIFTVPMPAVLAMSAPFEWRGIVFFFGGLSIAIFGVVWTSTMQTQVPKDHLSRVISWGNIGPVYYLPLGLWIAPSLAAVFGTGVTLWLATACGVLYVVGALGVGEIRRLQNRSGQ